MRLVGLGFGTAALAGLAALSSAACSAPVAPATPDMSGACAGAGAGLPSAASGGVAAAGANGGAGGGGGASQDGGASQAGGAPQAGSAGASDSGALAGSGGNASTPPAVPLDPTLLAQCSGTKPILCKLDAPNGNYDVTVDVGADDATASSRVEAETRHAFAAERATTVGEHQLLTMTVNVRAEAHDGGQSAPANVLDLTIAGDAPRLRGLGFRPAPAAITLFVAGDSTLCDWIGSNASAVSDDEMGWAQALAQYFAPGVAIANYADSGETAGGFYGKFFPPARDAMKAGDYLFVQFGHNDQKAQGSIDAYKTNVMKYVSDARERQVVPVLFTPVARKGNADFAGIDEQARQLAADEQIALIDLTMLSFAHYATVANKDALFVDGTHLSSQGANEVAGLVAAAIKTSSLPLKSLVK